MPRCRSSTAANDSSALSSSNGMLDQARDWPTMWSAAKPAQGGPHGVQPGPALLQVGRATCSSAVSVRRGRRRARARWRVRG